MEQITLTGYPSIDRPWLKYYSEEAINAPLPECTMYEYVWQNNIGHFSDVALRYYGAKITYGKLFENIRSAAKAFYDIGIRVGDIVTIMSMHTPETIYAIYALNYLGAVTNMVYMTLSEQEIVGTLKNTESKLLLALDAALERVEAVRDEISVPVIVLGVADSMPPHMKVGYALKTKSRKYDFPRWKDFMKRGEGKSLPPMSTGHAAPSVIVYTSGTTGEPKGVMLSNDNINAVAVQCRMSGKSYQRGETFFDNIPSFFGFGISMLHLGMASGIEMILWLELSPEAIAKGFARAKPNRYAGGPPVVDPIMRNATGKLSYLIEFTGGGEALAPEKEQELNLFLSQHESTAKYTTGYGMSEVVSVVCAQQNHLYRPESLGIPLPQSVVKIVNTDSGEELPYGETGEMCFCTPNMMLGYYKNQEETNKIIEVDSAGNRWLHTGDLGCVDEDGYVYYKGRIKRIYLAGGQDGAQIYKIFPQRIEECFEAQPFVENCGVIVREDAVRINAPIAFVKLKNREANYDDAVNKLKFAAETELPDHMWPKNIYIMDELPMTATGKIDYRALERKLAELQNG